MAWVYSPTSGWTLNLASVGVYESVVAGSDLSNFLSFASPGAIRAKIKDPAKPVGVRLFCHPDLRTGWEVITTGGTGDDIVIRKVIRGSPQLASDTAAHGLSTGSPFTLTVRAEGSKILAYIDGSSTAVVEFDTAGEYNEFPAYGFASVTDQAVCHSFETIELVPTFAERADVLWGVAGGFVSCSVNSSNIITVAQGQFPPGADVSGAELDQKVYLVGGGAARIFDPATMTVSFWKPTDGSLPGQAVDGTTTSTLCENHLGRMVVNDGSNLWYSRINDPLDFDTTPFTDGDSSAAFALTAATSGKIGQPIRAIKSAPNNRLIVGCSRSIWVIRGDPALGAIEAVRVADDVGVVGKDAITIIDQDRIAVHTTKGLAIITPTDGILFVSAPVLTQYIQPIQPFETLMCSMVQDVQRHGLVITMTDRVQPDLPPVHVWYDERVGGYGASKGGFFPEEYPQSVGPMATANYLSKPMLLGRDGYFYTFDDDASSDHGSTAIGARVSVVLMRAEDLDSGFLLYSSSIVFARGTDRVDVAVYGARTPEDALLGTSSERWLLWAESLTDMRSYSIIQVSAPAMVMEFSNFQADQWFGVERVQIETAPAVMDDAALVAAPVPAAYPTATSTPAEEDIEFPSGPANDGTYLSDREDRQVEYHGDLSA